MMKIFKPLIFAICLVVAFAVGYTIGPGKGQGVDNSDEVQRLQKQLGQKNKQIASLQGSLNALKEDQANLRQDLEASQKQLGATATMPASNDQYSANNDAKAADLTFYSDLPSQDVTPEPLHADPAKLAKAAAQPKVVGVDAKATAQTKNPSTEKAPGTSTRPLAANEVKSSKKASTASQHSGTQNKEKPLPARYIPPGFNGSTAASKATTTKTSKTGNYAVQVASLKTKDACTPLISKLKKQGFSAHIKEAQLKTGVKAYRVVVGPYQGFSVAKAARAELKKKTGTQGLIIRIK